MIITGDSGPCPHRVLSIDLGHPTPEFSAGSRYSTAMVVGYPCVVPVGAVDVRLTDDPADADLPSVSVVVSR